MRKFIFIFVIGALLASCSGNKDQFSIKGHINGIDTGMVYLQKFDADQWANVDSTKLDKGSFTFKGQAAMPEMRHITMQEKDISVPVFVENAAIAIEIYPDSLDKSSIKGSATQDIYQKYLTMNETINQKMEAVYKEWKAAKEAKDTVTMKQTDSISNELDIQLKNQLKDFIKTNNKTVVSPYLVMKNSWQFDLPELEEILTAIDTSLNQSQYIQWLNKRIDILRSVAIGQIAPDFTMNDSTGKPLALSSLKGKILLVDFWASWCGPCRAENPNVVKAFQAYNKKGFDVLGCSFDQNREKWLKAVNNDKLTWNQVSDLKGWGNAAGKLYGINSIPANVLLDKDMKIIGRNLRGEELMAKLAGILGPAPKK
ncbi:MAG: TlpA disulfide reductase family protein [Bacteroidetes bacterium]|nr:TlpA disulfide reductase family protein [Bacteroidota bacterium]